MIYLKNDYCEGAHPRILQALFDTNAVKTDGYSMDEYCEEAAGLIKAACGMDDVDVHFLVGGTIANLTVISSALRPYQSVIAADSGHIAVHETGAIEATGHKVLTIRAGEGRLTPDGIDEIVREHSDEHMVEPKMVYISNASEYGTLYRSRELEELSRYCNNKGLYLFCDGARMAQALASPLCDYDLRDVARACDVFYLGGTKNGLLMGEAVVIVNEELKRGFRHVMKRQGGMLAKGRLLGVQFAEALRDGVSEECARNAVEKMADISSILRDFRVECLFPSETNMAFPIFEEETIDALSGRVAFELSDRVDNSRRAIRLVTSWATGDAQVDEFRETLKEIL
jgi:threonine aldolase